jgi:hypothetical protein
VVEHFSVPWSLQQTYLGNSPWICLCPDILDEERYLLLKHFVHRIFWQLGPALEGTLVDEKQKRE